MSGENLKLKEVRQKKNVELRFVVVVHKHIFHAFLFSSGSYRECFQANIILGHPDDPVIPQPDCRLAKTQKDSTSSIRACLCTEDYCNIEEEGKF